METKFNFKSAVCTSRSQSEKLLALGLKPETADMSSDGWNDPVVSWGMEWSKEVIESGRLPAWSLHRLLLLIPKEVNIDGFRFPLRSDAVMRLDEADDMYEYLIGVLERTIKEGYFNKEYLV